MIFSSSARAPGGGSAPDARDRRGDRRLHRRLAQLDFVRRREGEEMRLHRGRTLDEIRERAQDVRVGRLRKLVSVVFGIPDADGEDFRPAGGEQQLVAKPPLLAKDRQDRVREHVRELLSGVRLQRDRYETAEHEVFSYCSSAWVCL